MKAEAQRIAIAEACGHKMDSPKEFPTVGIHENGARYLIPDYLNSLDAMHEAEKVLTRGECYQFNALLIDVKKPRSEMRSESEKWTWHSEASKRAEAFLKTKKLWKDQPPTP